MNILWIEIEIELFEIELFSKWNWTFENEIELFKIELLYPRAKTKMKKVGAAQGKILYKCGPRSMKFGPISIWRVLVDLRLFNGANLCFWWRKKRKMWTAGIWVRHPNSVWFTHFYCISSFTCAYAIAYNNIFEYWYNILLADSPRTTCLQSKLESNNLIQPQPQEVYQEKA